MGPPGRQCQVCNEAQSKYKCPNCLAPYCSLQCCKKHKETPCTKPEPKEEKSKLPAERPLNVDKPSEVLEKEQLESIASSSEICDALKGESLQKLILVIDSSPNPEDELEKFMGSEEFRTFTDKILSSIGPTAKQMSPHEE